MPNTLIQRDAVRAQSSNSATVFESRLGWMALEFQAARLHGVKFGYRSLADLLGAGKLQGCEIVDSVPTWVSDLCDRLQSFAAGQPQDFGDMLIDTQHLTPFAVRVVSECRKLEWGSTSTYAQLAAKAGRPGAARAVGNVMATNRFPLVVPCHRVVGAGGSLGGYSAPGGLATKRRLLEAEGVL